MKNLAIRYTESIDEVMFVLMVSDPNGETKWGFDVSANE